MTLIDRSSGVFHQKQKGPVKLTTRFVSHVCAARLLAEPPASSEAAAGAPNAATPPCLRKSRRFISYLRSCKKFLEIKHFGPVSVNDDATTNKMEQQTVF